MGFFFILFFAMYKLFSLMSSHEFIYLFFASSIFSRKILAKINVNEHFLYAYF